MTRSKPATMAEIAERAGVALSTVSYVLSGKRTVSQKLRERVLAAIEELDYRPHGPARALASGASHTIALFLPSPQWQLVPGAADVRGRRHAGDEREATMRCCSRRPPPTRRRSRDSSPEDGPTA